MLINSEGQLWIKELNVKTLFDITNKTDIKWQYP